MHRLVQCLLRSALVLTPAASVQATALPAGSGWHDDVITAPLTRTANSPWTFTIAFPAILSIVDGFIPGDIYTLDGDLSGTTAFYAGSSSAIQATGVYGGYWSDASYSKLALRIMPGSYSFAISGNGAGG